MQRQPGGGELAKVLRGGPVLRPHLAFHPFVDDNRQADRGGGFLEQDQTRRDIERRHELKSARLTYRRVVKLVWLQEFFDDQMSIAGPGVVEAITLMCKRRSQGDTNSIQWQINCLGNHAL